MDLKNNLQSKASHGAVKHLDSSSPLLDNAWACICRVEEGDEAPWKANKTHLSFQAQEDTLNYRLFQI